MGPVVSWVLLLLVYGPSFEEQDTKKQGDALWVTLQPVLFPVVGLDLPGALHGLGLITSEVSRDWISLGNSTACLLK